MASITKPKSVIIIYLEYEDGFFVRVDGANLYPSYFANRYIRVKGDNKYEFSKNETGVYMTDIHYPWLVFKKYNGSVFSSF